MDAVEFYDDFVTRQIQAGIHYRHLSIQRYLEKFTLNKNTKVLEIGCGIGTQSELLLRYLSAEGSLIGLDIGNKNIEYAKNSLSKYENAEFRCLNLVDTDIPETNFDLILCPDVLEHIPIDSHDILFSKFYKLLNKDGRIVVHIPHPAYLQWVHENRPEELQIIDQPLFLNIFSKTVYNNGFQIDYLESYSIFAKPYDYQVMLITKSNNVDTYSGVENPIHDTLFRRLSRKVKYILRGNK